MRAFKKATALGLVAAAAGLSTGALAAGPVAGPASCPSERAVYEMRAEQGEFRVSLIPARNMASAASDLYLRLTTPQRDYWFTFAVSNGYGRTLLVPVTDAYAPEGPRALWDESEGGGVAEAGLAVALPFYSLDAELGFLPEPPQSGEAAPPYLMMPEIGPVLWYDPSSISADAGAESDPMPPGMFRRTACLVAPHPKANP